jgi:hypothetical protein
VSIRFAKSSFVRRRGGIARPVATISTAINPPCIIFEYKHLNDKIPEYVIIIIALREMSSGGEEGRRGKGGGRR